MGLTSISLNVGANPLDGKVGLGGVTGAIGSMPAIPAMGFGQGDSAGNLTVVGFWGTVPYGTPVTAAGAAVGIDLSACPDMSGVTLSAARIKALLVLNWSTTDGQNLVVDTTVTNGATAFTGAAAGKITVPAGYTNGQQVVPGRLLLGAPSVTGFAVSGTTKILSLNPGAATIPYTVFALGNLT